MIPSAPGQLSHKSYEKLSHLMHYSTAEKEDLANEITFRNIPPNNAYSSSGSDTKINEDSQMRVRRSRGSRKKGGRRELHTNNNLLAKNACNCSSSSCICTSSGSDSNETLLKEPRRCRCVCCLTSQSDRQNRFYVRCIVGLCMLLLGMGLYICFILRCHNTKSSLSIIFDHIYNIGALFQYTLC